METQNPIIFDDKALKRIPPALVFILILILGLPAIGLNYFGINFEVLTQEIDSYNTKNNFLTSELRNFFIQILLQWAAFSLAFITTLLAFTQYRLTNDKIAFVIGLSILFSGAIEAAQTLVIDGPPYIFDKENLDTLIWIFTNSVSGLILIIGFTIILLSEKNPFRIRRVHLLSFLLLSLAIASVYYATFIFHHPKMWFKDEILSRPYDLIYVGIYLVIICFFYPSIYRRYPTILSNCIFYMGVTQIVIAMYLMLLSNHPYDLAYNIAYFLKIMVYFIPFACLIINYVFSYNSILEAQVILQEGQEKLQYHAAHDPLTDLYNRREFENLLDKTIANSARDYHSFALFLIDIDNFKNINDSLGHIHGDNFLKKFSDELVILTRRGDILSRIGGDEFTLITSKLVSPSSARKIAERFVKGLAIKYEVGNQSITSSVSIGVAIYPTDGDNIDDLMKHADIALYNAKKLGKNAFQFYAEKINFRQRREAEIEIYLHDAIEKNEFSLFFQPQYNLVTKEIIGAEILLRWTNQHLGTIAPDEFIPIAENCNLILSIGKWVMYEACKQAKAWTEKYHQHLLFSINVSPVQFENGNFYNDLKKMLEQFNYPSHNIGIEITENLLMKNNELVNISLKNISDLGIGIFLDDFGMGYSSLSRLKLLPINTIKIDKLFVADIQNEVDKISLIDMIIKLAHEMDMDIIAEGIETAAQLNYLVARKCMVGQGYYLSKPIPAEQFELLAYHKKQ